MNAYQSGERKVVPACLIYAKAGGRVLMLNRNVKGRGDIHLGKWNGLGGKFEPDESPVEAARREFQEEAGVDLPLGAFKSLGVLQFPNFKAANSEDWIVYVFEALPDGVMLPAEGVFQSGPEGELSWIKEELLLDLPLWEGDREFLPLVLASRPFIGTYWYQNGKLTRSWLKTL